MNVLICGAANVIAIGTARTLCQAGHRAVFADSNRFARGFLSKFCFRRYLFRDSSKDQPGFEDDLADCLRNERIDLVVPSTDQALLDLAGAMHVIPPEVSVSFPADVDKIRLVLHKGNLPGICAAAGVQTPRTLRHAEVEAPAPDRRAPPWVVKRTAGVAGQGLARVVDYKALGATLEETARKYPGEELLVQEEIEGKVYGAGGLFDGEQLKFFYCYEYVNRSPLGSGPATRCLLRHVEPVRGAFQKVLASLDWRGYCQMDFIVDAGTGEPFLVDINPVHWYTMPFSASARLNSILGLLPAGQSPFNEEPLEGPYATVCLTRELQRLLTWLFRGSGNRVERLRLFNHVRAFSAADFFWDPLPILLAPVLKLLAVTQGR